MAEAKIRQWLPNRIIRISSSVSSACLLLRFATNGEVRAIYYPIAKTHMQARMFQLHDREPTRSR
jgi:hypothetical protein